MIKLSVLTLNAGELIFNCSIAIPKTLLKEFTLTYMNYDLKNTLLTNELQS